MQTRFREKSFYVKLTTFAVTKNIKFGRKLLSYSESSSKINLRSHGTVFEILPTSAVIAFKEFGMKTRLPQKVQMPQTSPRPF